MRLLAIALSLIAFSAHAYVVTPDVIYDSVNGVNVALDIYQPTTLTNKKLPVLAFIHGGCFNMGSRKDIPNELKMMADEGFVVVSIGYRLANVAKYPAAVTDVQQAIRFLRKNANQYSINADKIVVHGESAGGYLAAVLGVRDLPDRENKLDQYSGRVQLVSDWFGRTDFTQRQTTGTDCAEVFLGKPRTEENLPAFKEASLAKDVDSKSSDFIIVHGSNDQQVYPLHSVLLANKLWKNGKQANLTFYENEGHGFNRTAPWNLTRNLIRLYLGMPLTNGLSKDNIYEINFNVDASGRPRGSFDLQLALGQGPAVPVAIGLKAEDLDARLNYKARFNIISKTRKMGLSAQNFSDLEDKPLIKVKSSSTKFR